MWLAREIKLTIGSDRLEEKGKIANAEDLVKGLMVGESSVDVDGRRQMDSNDRKE